MQSNHADSRVQGENILVLIDWENLYFYCKKQRNNEDVELEVILDYARTLGRVRHVLAFVGFMDNSAVLVRELHSHGIEPRFTMTKQNFKDKPIKNAADIHLAVTAMQFAYTRPGIQGFLIVSGDQGFLPLLRELKMYGRSVNILSMSFKPTIRQLDKEADSIAYYDNLIKPKGDE